MTRYPTLIFSLFALFLGFLPLDSEALAIKDNLSQAKKGDYFITAIGKNLTVLFVKGRRGDQVFLEEIMVPYAKAPVKTKQWQSWLDQGAPHHTSWQVFAIDLTNGKMSDIFSYSRQTWLRMVEGEKFVETLLALELKPTPKHKRKKIGPPPMPGDIDRRSDWHPPLSFNGHKVEGVKFGSWECYWPKDKSELSGKHILIFLPEERSRYPAYFPYWLQVAGMTGKAKVRVVDAGENLLSQTPLPFQFLS